MTITFEPVFTLTPEIVHDLLRIETAKTKITHQPLTAWVLASLRESARLNSTHYSTMIEGNRLTIEQVDKVVQHKGHFPGRERDEHEVKAYYTALTYVEQCAARKQPITEAIIQMIHALVVADGRSKVRPTPYRDGQNVIKEGGSGRIVYMPPQANDVAQLMSQLIAWLNAPLLLPAPLIASIVHYQFATIHPYYDGNGRTARLITTLILHLKGYDLKGLYTLEEYYARDLSAYYRAIYALYHALAGPRHLTPPLYWFTIRIKIED